MKKIVLLIITIFLITACSSDSESVFVPQNIEPILVGKGSILSPFDSNNNSQYLIIENQNDWDSFVQTLEAAGNISQILVETDIDFSNFTVIALIDKRKPTYGNTIDILNITENENDITVSVGWLIEGDALTPSQALHIVRIEKINKPIIFQ